MCAEEVKDEALRCRFCSTDLPSPAHEFLKYIVVNGGNLSYKPGPRTLHWTGPSEITTDENRQKLNALRPQLISILSMLPSSVNEQGEVEHKYLQTAASTSSVPKLKYPSLRALAGIYQGVAVLYGVCTFIAAMLMIQSANGVMLGPTLVVGAFGVFAVVTMLAISESIIVLLDIEANTRQQRI